MKTTNKNAIVFVLFLGLLLSNTGTGNAQNYRNPKAYINDFGKNELFVNESLVEYSAAVMNISPDYRVQSTLERIYSKLENVNTILLRNDKGVSGDTELRDAFIQMNSKTITLLKNKTLILNDYSFQSALDYSDILKNFAVKENEITNYYKGITNYENSKRQFALRYNIILKTAGKKNVFEYNAYQNLIFYKINVLDDKLTLLLKERNIEKVKECFNYMDQVGQESFKKTEQFRYDFKDTSLNNANIEMLTFMLKQKEALLPSYINYVKTAEEFQRIKADKSISVDNYNAEVRRYNSIKNLFFDNVYNLQLKKKELLDAWYITNSKFLKNNTEFENQQDKITVLD